MIRQAKEDPINGPSLHACDIYDFCCRTAVWINREYLKKLPATPANCWIQ
jgi:hypothetical protein